MSYSNTMLGVVFLIFAVVLIIILIRLLMAGDKTTKTLPPGKGGKGSVPGGSGDVVSIPPGKVEKIGDRPIPPGSKKVEPEDKGGGLKGDLRHIVHDPPDKPVKGEMKQGDDEVNRIYSYQPVYGIKVCRYCETENAASAAKCCVCNQYLR